ncbi:hypothetical protein ACGF07_25510 [Kitasatospora sp. NPDC048194]|uniref:VG15 protein n=1 Tax=Kitasatospora sp. NPDC048194 TaxID=3364045 RepID=UPI00371DE885
MDAEALAIAHYRRQRRITLAALRAATREWRQLPQDAITEAWMSATGDRVFAIIAAAQLAAATGSTSYVSAAVTAQGADGQAPEFRVDPAAFTRVAADGRPLESLLYQPIIRTKQAIGGGAASGDALDQGLSELLRIVGTEVPDAGRQAVGAGITADRRTTGYVRVLSPPSCARCVVLAGKEYGWNSGFQRHPHCDCVHLPITRYRRGVHTMDPEGYFRSLSRAEQDRVFTIAGARAIRDGADIGQIVNARRGLYTIASGTHGGRLLATREGMTKRGLAARRLKSLVEAGRAPARARLMPEAIYKLASDRNEAIRLLHRYGFLY